MEERILKKIAVFVTVVSLAVCIALPFFPRLNTASEEFFAAVKEYRMKTKAEQMNMTGLELMAYNNAQAEEESGKKLSLKSQIELKLPLGVAGSDLEITKDELTRTITIRIPYAGEEYMYEYPILGENDGIESLTYEYKEKSGLVEFVMEQVYEPKFSYDEEYLYLDFLTPQELYDKVIVIDAGHGGEDTGTVKQGISEKDINLDIVLELKEILETSKESIGVYYTRTTDVNPDQKQRAELAENTNADLFLSIHNNATQSGRMSSINGTQVMFDKTEEEQEYTSKGLAQICLEEVTAMTGSSNKGLIEEKEETVIFQRKMPAVLIEAGFMTNETELDHLCSKEYQSKIAQGIYHAVLRAFEEGY